MWLKTPVEERDERGNRHMSGGKRSTCGTPQGGVASPMLANVYMNRFLKYWRSSGRDSAYQAHVVSYADDFVILSCGHAEEAMEWTGQVMTKLGLKLNGDKTSVRDARKESFDFLGYAFGPHYYRKDGRRYWDASPSKKSVQRLKRRVGDILGPGNQAPWPEVRGQLNSLLRGWSSYFSYGTRLMAYRAADSHVYHSVRRFLRRRRKVQSQGMRRFSDEVVFDGLGVLRLRSVHLGPMPTAAR
jgi:RNA-directed DNA polymerase